MSNIDISATFIRGRLTGVSRRQVFDALSAADARLVRSAAKASVVVFAHSSARAVLSGGAGIVGQGGLSEDAFMRRIGLRAERPSEHGAYGSDDLLRLSGLDDTHLAVLQIYDVLDADEGCFTFEHLRIAREVARHLKAGLPIADIVTASHTLARVGASLASAQVSAAPWGAVLQTIAGRLAGLDGQYAMDLMHTSGELDDIVAQAQDAEACEDWSRAERLYGRAAKLDRDDPVYPFNLGNVLAAQGRPAEAVIAFQKSLERDARFSEAWFNIGCLREEAGRPVDALTAYRAAREIQPEYGDALFNEARLLTELSRYTEAQDLWTRFVARWPADAHIEQARRSELVCRLSSRNAAPGSSART